MKPTIEIGIKPLVDAMHATGRIRTIASCQGHWGLWWVRPAYVYFKCEAALGENLASMICLEENNQSRLNYHWQFTGLTHPELGLSFSLSMPYRWFSRRKFDEDVGFLASLVETLT
jgi:hypothetical protein